MAEHRMYANAVLRSLDPHSMERLRLRRVDLSSGTEVAPHGRHGGQILFLESGIASLRVLFSDGSEVEAGIIGAESVIGVDSLMGNTGKPNGIVMQVAGLGYCCRMENAEQEFSRCGAFHKTVLECVQAHHSQAARIAGCNAKHEIIQRIPRWLLMCSDRLSGSEIYITHEMICSALGVSRSTVTTALDKLQSLGVIVCGRGRLRIVDAHALGGYACECYASMKIRNPVRIQTSTLRVMEPVRSAAAIRSIPLASAI